MAVAALGHEGTGVAHQARNDVAEPRGSRRETVSRLRLLDRRLEVVGEQGPEVLRPDAGARMGAEERMLDLRAEAPPPEPRVYCRSQNRAASSGSKPRARASSAPIRSASFSCSLLNLERITELIAVAASAPTPAPAYGALDRPAPAALLPAEETAERRAGAGADNLVTALPGALPAQ